MNGTNIHPLYKLVEVNHVRKYPKYDPFVLSYQASQVYFAPYPSLKRDRVQWWAIFKTKARSDIDAPLDLDFYQEEVVDVRPTLCAPDEVPDYDDQEEDDNEVIPQNVHTDENGDSEQSYETNDDDDDGDDQDDVNDEEEDEDFDDFDAI